MNKFNITHTDYSEEIRNAMEAGLIVPAGGDRVHIVNMEDISGTYSYAEINDLLNHDEEKAEIVNISIDDLPLTA